MKIKVFVLSLFVVVAGLTACGKYEEGPGLSLRSKKARFVNTWLIEAIELDGKNVTADIASAGGLFNEVEFKEDGSYFERYTGTTDKGKWEFADGKEKVKFTPEAVGAVATEGTIKKLKENAMWIEEEVDVLGVKQKLLYKLKAKNTVY
ncbi:MAG: hypothetical protein EAZ95_03100 [Bacteroidetes bacterium]|nr:MAG: hypothetical protein EAZ95_03100 [Bacteroidota bacterium]